MADLVNISVPNAFAAAVLGYGVVFLGLVLLMFVLQIMGKIMHREAPAAPAPEPEEKRWHDAESASLLSMCGFAP